MRLVTWNCQSGTAEDRLERLHALHPDVVAVQEVRQPRDDTERANWRGRYRTKGQAVFVVGKGCTSRTLRVAADTALSVLPVEVTSPVSMVVVGVWTHRTPSYVTHLLNGMAAIRHLVQGRPVVLMGDFNSDPKVNRRAHNRLVNTLTEEYGLVSAYHEKLRHEPGLEPHRTYYHRRKPDDTWHCDFCFVPEQWVPYITNVEVGGYADWMDSDHRPVMVEIDLPHS